MSNSSNSDDHTRRKRSAPDARYNPGEPLTDAEVELALGEPLMSDRELELLIDEGVMNAEERARIEFEEKFPDFRERLFAEIEKIEGKKRENNDQ